MDNYKVKKMRKRLKAAMDELSPEDLEMIRKYIEPDEVEREPETDYISTFEISLMLRNVDDSP